MSKTRGFELVEKFTSMFSKDNPFIFPRRATMYSACYDIFNNTGKDIVLEPGELSPALTTYLKAYMLNDEVLMAFVRSGHGFKYSVRLANSTGIIDSDYYNNSDNEGEIFVKLHNQGTKQLIIPKGEGMAQVMFQKYLLTDDDESTRGGIRGGGIGSTSKT